LLRHIIALPGLHPGAWRYDLIDAVNPSWRDLAEDFGFPALVLK
jgi:hypothetical protein